MDVCIELLYNIISQNIIFFVLRFHKNSDKTDDQTQRIQQLIRENFELFIRCADGVDLFKTGRSRKHTPGVHDWLNRLESLAQTTSNNAKKSFKPLLDNTNEVRKVQSALAVLQRVGPLLQVPSLMRQHIENGRFSAAVSTYRRSLVIDDNNKIQLLRHVKLKAAEAARDARIDLETRLANPNLPVHVSILSFLLNGDL
jgi:exocyst complex component 2